MTSDAMRVYAAEWALCMIVITWYKTTILERKLPTGTSKTKKV